MVGAVFQKSWETGQEYKYGKLKDDVYRLAASLTKLGIKSQDVILLLSPNVIEYAVIYLATTLIGATITTVNPAYTACEYTLDMGCCKLNENL